VWQPKIWKGPKGPYAPEFNGAGFGPIEDPQVAFKFSPLKTVSHLFQRTMSFFRPKMKRNH
jgi:hypothetical protein